MNKNLFDKDKLVSYFKTRPIQLVDNSKITSVEISDETYNPLDCWYINNLYFDNDLIITIRSGNFKFQEPNAIQVKAGKYSGWIGGLAYTEASEVFYIKEVSTDRLIEGFKNNLNKQLYSLCSLHSSGNINMIHSHGTLEKLNEYASDMRYIKKKAHECYAGTFKEFYYVNELPCHYSDKIFKIFAI